MRFRVAFLALLSLLAASAGAAEKSSRDAYDRLNALRVDPATLYEIEPANRIELRRGDVQFSLEQGKLAFLQLFEGRLVGAVFLGRGHILAAPRDPVEKQQMAHFLGAPVLDQDFTSACLRFTDDTAADLLRQLREGAISPRPDSVFAAHWDALLAKLNPSQALRVLFDSLSQTPRPYFYGAIDGITTGPFDVVLDPLRRESLLLGQIKKGVGGTFYDVWASYNPPEISPPAIAFRALRYAIDTSILISNSLEAKTEVLFRAETGGERLLSLQLSHMLNIEEVSDEHGEPLTYFQNEGMTLRERSTHGNDFLYVVLPSAPAPGTEFSLRFRYRGNVIEDAGNGVLYVGARESWYPHFGDAADFADYDLTMHWPRRLRLVATGVKLDEREDGDFRVGRWHTEKPASVAGFNLGDYAFASLSAEGHSVEVYANRILEQALNNRLGTSTFDVPRMAPPFSAEAQTGANLMQPLPLTPPSPADALKQLGRDIDSSIRFYEKLSGPFPFQKLGVSQIPGTFGQGWPGLLYISTYSFLPPAAQQRAGLSQRGQEHFTELVPFHEVAHQWWGNLVGWSVYRDQWIDEALANYFALLFADSQKNANHSLRVWLARYRQRLVEKLPGAEQPASEIGALDLGNRLSSSKSPEGFEQIIYGKGSWVIHMVREMLRQPGAKDPDARFVTLLHTLAGKYAYRALSSADLQHEIEAVMTPGMDLDGNRSMEWFFEDWVRGTGVPHYRVEFSVHPSEKGFLVRGKLFQSDVPRSFMAPVPLYSNVGAGHLTQLGVVIAAGPETTFHFTTLAAPAKIVIDPHMTILCVSD
jgi:Peptidase family M1 domain